MPPGGVSCKVTEGHLTAPILVQLGTMRRDTANSQENNMLDRVQQQSPNRLRRLYQQRTEGVEAIRQVQAMLKHWLRTTPFA